MTNFERWQIYTKDFVSPQNYIDFGFYYMASAALQRRVWIGGSHAPIFGNVYTVLVGDAGVGKGLVIKQVTSFLKHNKMPDPDTKVELHKPLETSLDATDKHAARAVEADDFKRAREVYSKKDVERPLLFPVAADATTYEALCKAFSRSTRHINYPVWNVEKQKFTLGVYAHASLCFSLEELSSLFKRKAEEVAKMLLNTYDCGDYEYDTKTQGTDRIKKCCLNLFGGTTPTFMEECFSDRLLNDGLASRTFFIFAATNRKTSFFIPELNEEQKQARDAILAHLEKLSHLYGQVQLEPQTMPFLEEWWKSAQISRPNPSYKLNSYYARKNQHVAKLAMALHFSENTTMLVPHSCFLRAIDILGAEEKKMHYALGMEATNPLARPSRKILRYLQQTEPKMITELLAEFWEDLPGGRPDLEEILEHLIGTGKVKPLTVKNERLHRDVTVYTVIRSANEEVSTATVIAK